MSFLRIITEGEKSRIRARHLYIGGSALAARRPFESELVSNLKRHERQSSLKFRPETSGVVLNLAGALPSHLAAATTPQRAVRQPRAEAASTERDSTMEKYLGRFSPYIYAILRIVVGFIFMLHGTQKLFGAPAMPGNPPGGPLPTLLRVGGVIELVCGLLVMIGLLAGWAAFLASGEMAVAYFMAHFPRHPLPVVNQGDPAVLFCFIFLYIASVGAGIWSVDSLLRRKGPAQPLDEH